MNNETSFKQHNKEMFIIVAGVKEWESVPGQYVGPWFVESVYEASSNVFFSDGFQVESVAVMWERGLFVSLAHGSLTVDTQKEGTRKNSSWEEEGINALCQLIGQWVT